MDDDRRELEAEFIREVLRIVGPDADPNAYVVVFETQQELGPDEDMITAGETRAAPCRIMSASRASRDDTERQCVDVARHV